MYDVCRGFEPATHLFQDNTILVMYLCFLSPSLSLYLSLSLFPSIPLSLSFSFSLSLSCLTLTSDPPNQLHTHYSTITPLSLFIPSFVDLASPTVFNHDHPRYTQDGNPRMHAVPVMFAHLFRAIQATSSSFSISVPFSYLHLLSIAQGWSLLLSLLDTCVLYPPFNFPDVTWRKQTFIIHRSYASSQRFEWPNCAKLCTQLL